MTHFLLWPDIGYILALAISWYTTWRLLRMFKEVCAENAELRAFALKTMETELARRRVEKENAKPTYERPDPLAPPYTIT